MIISFTVAFVVAYIFGVKEEVSKVSEKIHQINTDPNTIYAPLSGRVIPLEEIPDQTFASGIMGKGIGIEPDSDTVFAPFDGTVIMVTDTKHAIGIKSNDGI